MKVLSLFDGISIAQQALKNIGITPKVYYASEIDKYAIQITQKNFPNTIQVGDVKKFDYIEQTFFLPLYKEIDLMIGGSPCQDLSIAKKDRKGLNGERSSLFWEYVRILNEVKPKYFVLENVNSMPKEAKELITQTLGVEPIMINAALVSAQNRKRLFWVGKLVGDTYEQVKIDQPQDKGILLKDILESDVDEKFIVKDSHNFNRKSYGAKGKILEQDSEKTPTLQAAMGCGGGRGAKTGLYVVARASVQKNAEQYSDGKTPALTSAMGMGGGNVPLLMDEETAEKLKGAYIGEERQVIRKLTPIECERLQSLPDNYTEGVSNTQRYKALGNGFNCAVIEHILKYIL